MPETNTATETVPTTVISSATSKAAKGDEYFTKPEGILGVLGMHGLEHVMVPGAANKLTGLLDISGRIALVGLSVQGGRWLYNRYFGNEGGAEVAVAGGFDAE